MKYLRRVAKKTRRDHERNSKIREELGVRQITTELEEKQLKWSYEANGKREIAKENMGSEDRGKERKR